MLPRIKACALLSSLRTWCGWSSPILRCLGMEEAQSPSTSGPAMRKSGSSGLWIWPVAMLWPRGQVLCARPGCQRTGNVEAFFLEARFHPVGKDFHRRDALAFGFIGKESAWGEPDVEGVESSLCYSLAGLKVARALSGRRSSLNPSPKRRGGLAPCFVKTLSGDKRVHFDANCPRRCSIALPLAIGCSNWDTCFQRAPSRVFFHVRAGCRLLGTRPMHRAVSQGEGTSNRSVRPRNKRC